MMIKPNMLFESVSKLHLCLASMYVYLIDIDNRLFTLN